MLSRPLLALALAVAASLSAAATPAQAAPVADPDPFAWTQLTPTYAATGRYGYEPLAASGGYVRTDECVPDMGYHYANPAYLDSLDPATPAALLYEDGPRGRTLTAVEWAVEDTGQETPKLFGQTFDEGRMPGYFTLHAWIYKKNADGLFTGLNPTVECPAAS